jgi:hypothetical protein
LCRMTTFKPLPVHVVDKLYASVNWQDLIT